MKIAGVLIGSLLLFLFSVTVMRLMPASRPAVSAEKVQKFHFPDGAELEVMGMSVGTRVVEVSPKNKRWPAFLNAKSYGESGYQNYKVKVEEINGEPFRVTTTPLSPGEILLEIRVRERGSYKEFDASLSDTSSDGKQFVTSPSAMRKVTAWFELKNDQPEMIGEEMKRQGLEILMQYQDSRGAWVSIPGPFSYQDPWRERGFFMLQAVERDQPLFHFRAIRANGQVVEFSLPNPDIRKPSSSITPVTLPHVYKGSGYDLTIREMRRESLPGRYPFSRIVFDVDTAEKSLHCVLLNAEDEWGNIASAFGPGWKPGGGVFLPASSQRMKAHFMVQRSINFPRFDYSGFALAEGVVSADGKQVNFRLLPDAKRFGCHSMAAVPLLEFKKRTANSDWGNIVPQDWRCLKLTVKGDIPSNVERESLQKRLGNIQAWQYLIFAEGSNQSTGVYWTSNGGGGGGSIFESSHNWLLPPEMVQPGKRIRIGVHAPIADEFFTVDLPTH